MPIVRMAYTQDGRLWSLRARHVVMASGGWVNRYIVRDLPDANRAATHVFIIHRR
jgi:hypothetical protein